MVRRTLVVASSVFALGCGPSAPDDTSSSDDSRVEVLVAAFRSVSEKSPEVQKLLALETYRLTPAEAPNQSMYSWMFDEGRLAELGAPRDLLSALDSIASRRPTAIPEEVFVRLGVTPSLGPDSDQLVDLGYQFRLATDSSRVILVALGTPLIRDDRALVDFNYRCDRVECWERGLVFLRFTDGRWEAVERLTYVFS